MEILKIEEKIKDGTLKIKEKKPSLQRLQSSKNNSKKNKNFLKKFKSNNKPKTKYTEKRINDKSTKQN